jgi:hypothetical protein
VHHEGVWLNDEASFFLATESLMPWAWDKTLPNGLDHLAGNGFLGLTTTISEAFGVADAQAFRFADATLGTLVVLLCVTLGASFFGRAAGLAAGLAAAVWPDLVFWSGTMLRDTFGSFVVIALWWTLRAAPGQRWWVTASAILFGLVILATLRNYLAVAAAVGVAAWLVYPLVRRQRARTLLGVAAAIVLIVGGVGLTQTRRLNDAAHEVLYRQTVTRMETLGRLYRDPPPLDQPLQLPFRPGAAITLVDARTGWLLPGLVEDSAETGFVNVGLTDDTSRRVPIGDVMLLQDAPIPPLQLFSWLTPSLLAVVVGLPTTSEAPNPAWIVAALSWDVLLIVGVIGLRVGRLPLREWLYPLFVTVGTVVALSAIPGAPGNAERHRATQTIPLLLVLASGVLVSARLPSFAVEGRAIARPRSMPARPSTAVASSRRSPR